MSVRASAAAALTAVALAVAGCGGGKAPSSGTPATEAGSTLKLRAGPGTKLRFNPDTLRAKAGKVTIVLSNPTPLSHNVSLQGSGVDEHGETVGEGGTSRVSDALKPGTYTFYCSVPGHREAGMQGTLTVK